MMLNSTSSFLLDGSKYFSVCVPQNLNMTDTRRSGCVIFFCLFFFLPGTTLNLLKFPIINPTCDRIFRRQERLKEEALKTEDQLSDKEKKHLNRLKKQGYLVGEYFVSKR